MFLQVNSTTEWLYTSTTILLLGLGTLVAFGLWAWYMVRRENKPFGEIMSVMLVHQNESILVGLTLLIFFSEAVLAASVHPPGETPPPPLARFFSHLAISIAGITANVGLMRMFAKIFEKGIDRVSLFARIFLCLALLLLAVGVPLANAMLISAGLGEDLKFFLFVQDYLNPFCSSGRVAGYISKYGGNPLEYRTWGGLSYVMKTTVVLTIVHCLVGIVMGLYNLSSQDRRKSVFADNPYGKKEGGDKEKGKKSEEEKRQEREQRDAEYAAMAGETRAYDLVEDNLTYLLRRMRYQPGAELDEKLKAATESLYGISKSQYRIQLATRIAALREECQVLDDKKKAGTITEDEKKAEQVRINKKIRLLFEGSPKDNKSNKRGLGITLKGKGK